MSPQPLPLFPEPRFDGRTYEPEQDRERLSTQLAAVKQVLEYGEPMTLDEIETEIAARGVKGNAASISARIRDLRKTRFGAHTILRMRVDGGVFAYQMVEDGGLES